MSCGDVTLLRWESFKNILLSYVCTKAGAGPQRAGGGIQSLQAGSCEPLTMGAGDRTRLLFKSS